MRLAAAAMISFAVVVGTVRVDSNAIEVLLAKSKNETEPLANTTGEAPVLLSLGQEAASSSLLGLNSPGYFRQFVINQLQEFLNRDDVQNAAQGRVQSLLNDLGITWDHVEVSIPQAFNDKLLAKVAVAVKGLKVRQPDGSNLKGKRTVFKKITKGKKKACAWKGNHLFDFPSLEAEFQIFSTYDSSREWTWENFKKNVLGSFEIKTVMLSVRLASKNRQERNKIAWEACEGKTNLDLWLEQLMALAEGDPKPPEWIVQNIVVGKTDVLVSGLVATISSVFPVESYTVTGMSKTFNSPGRLIKNIVWNILTNTGTKLSNAIRKSPGTITRIPVYLVKALQRKLVASLGVLQKAI